MGGCASAGGRVVAGIDGGGTKTLCVVFAQSTGAVGLGRGGPLNANYIPEADVESAVKQAISSACAAAGVPPAALTSAAFAAPWSEHLVAGVVRTLGARAAVTAPGEDATALMAGTLRPCGLVLIAGTGSRCAYVPEPGKGEAVVAGAWGSLFGDEGSGYQIGAEALRAVTKASDGRGPRTELAPVLFHDWGLSEPKELIQRIYGPPHGAWRARIASICPLVGSVAGSGDAVALGILDRAAGELARMVAVVSARAGLRPPVSVLLSGGVFRLGELIRRPLRRHLCAEGLEAVLSEPRMAPVYGAALLALDQAGDVPLQAREALETHYHGVRTAMGRAQAGLSAESCIMGKDEGEVSGRE